MDDCNTGNYSENLAKKTAMQALANITYNAEDPFYSDHDLSVEEIECWLLTNEIQSELLHHCTKGVCCFTSTPTCSLLWSHYGDQHNGLCIRCSSIKNPKPRSHKVVHDDSWTLNTSLVASALLQNDSTAKEELEDNVLLRKASPWEYDSEWRLFGSLDLQASLLAMTEITFGLRCPTSIIHIIVSALKDREDKIAYYSIEQVSGSCALSRTEMDLKEMGATFPITSRSGQEIFGPFEQ